MEDSERIQSLEATIRKLYAINDELATGAALDRRTIEALKRENDRMCTELSKLEKRYKEMSAQVEDWRERYNQIKEIDAAVDKIAQIFNRRM